MKYIDKSNPPFIFLMWTKTGNNDWQPTWNNLQGTVKGAVHKSLLEEQGCICCYCGIRITENSSHVEHLKPRSKYPQEEINYQNLLASCQRQQERGGTRHCGALKDNWYDDHLMISPLSPDCEEHFRFAADGSIYPKQDTDMAATETISHLGLNIYKLQALRRKAIEAIIDFVRTLTKGQIPLLADTFLKRNKEGKFPEFCTAIVYILRNYS